MFSALVPFIISIFIFCFGIKTVQFSPYNSREALLVGAGVYILARGLSSFRNLRMKEKVTIQIIVNIFCFSALVGFLEQGLST